ncbi:4-amino-4-deoxy-L-arabinose lipid A transferase, partial [Pseudomonas gingeri]|nr:4-amino-4-deoxy-L-arabinose lipid A transferase [Pseudomonas gingeri]
PYMIWQRRLGELLRCGPIAVVVAVVVALPWVLAVNAQEPDYWHFFFWHEHIQRFAGNNAQHAQPWWFYLPLLVVSCLPWSVMLIPTFKQAWQEKRQAGTGFLWLAFLLPLAFFSLSKGKLPTYIMPCLLPLALMMGNALIDRVARAEGRALRLNGMLNLILGLAALIGLIVLQATRYLYENSHAEVFNLSLVFIMLMAWIIANALQALRPLTLWAMPALGIALLVALLPAGMPASVINNKMPDQFIAEHIDELRQTNRLLSNELGAAAALSWRLQRPQVDLFNTAGELKYGLDYPDAAGRLVTFDSVGQWMSEARKQGPVGVVMRVRSVVEMQEIALLPVDGKRYKDGDLEIIIFPQTRP